MLRIKNHILPRGKALNSQLLSKFKISLADFDKACTGDLEAIQRIGILAAEAAKISKYAPKIKDAYLEIINGTTTYNLAIADILSEGGKNALSIDKAQKNTALDNQKFINSKIENNSQFLIDKKSENDRHNYQMNYQEIQGYLDAFISYSDREYQMESQRLRPEIKQIQSNLSYQDKLIDEYLEHGENAKIELIPARNYSRVKEGIKGLLSKMGF